MSLAGDLRRLDKRVQCMREALSLRLAAAMTMQSMYLVNCWKSVDRITVKMQALDIYTRNAI